MEEVYVKKVYFYDGDLNYAIITYSDNTIKSVDYNIACSIIKDFIKVNNLKDFSELSKKVVLKLYQQTILDIVERPQVELFKILSKYIQLDNEETVAFDNSKDDIESIELDSIKKIVCYIFVNECGEQIMEAYLMLKAGSVKNIIESDVNQILRRFEKEKHINSIKLYERNLLEIVDDTNCKNSEKNVRKHGREIFNLEGINIKHVACVSTLLVLIMTGIIAKSNKKISENRHCESKRVGLAKVENVVDIESETTIEEEVAKLYGDKETVLFTNDSRRSTLQYETAPKKIEIVKENDDRVDAVAEKDEIIKKEELVSQSDFEGIIHVEDCSSIIEPEVEVINSETQLTNYIAKFSLTPEQIDIIKATVQHEAGFNETEVYAVMSTVINRCESGRWGGGGNPYAVITASGQFDSYCSGYYREYVNGNYTDYTSAIVDSMLRGDKEPFHDYESFSSSASSRGVQYTKSGNRYWNKGM